MNHLSRVSSRVARRAFSSSSSRILTTKTINPLLLQAEYAVRGELVIKADAIREQIKKDPKSKPYDSLVSCNIGNPQDLGQKPITFFRQVLALCHYPQLINDPAAANLFPADARKRAQAYLNAIQGGTGAYSSSTGVKIVRDEVANFIAQRDGHPCNPDNIFLTDGASPAVKMVLQAMIAGPNDGVLTPIPQYPLYSASLALLGGHAVKYYLDENKGWGLSRAELERAVKEGRANGVNIRGLVIINPGNPTGQCLDAQNMRDIVDFCHKEKIVLLADEVYQTNIYSTTPFTSFKKVVCDMGAEYKDVELISFHSVSKGFLGECGQRGGYMELHNIDPEVQMQLYKLASISLCSNLTGQLMTGLMVNPPKQGDASFSLYETEKNSILDSLKRRATKVAAALNALPGVTCNPVEGALYAFPQVRLPPKAIQAAKEAGKNADTFYALALLDATGIVVVPGSGFGQQPGTFHYRTTILPSEEVLDKVMSKMAVFHNDFMAKYSS